VRLLVGSDARVRIGPFVDDEETPTDPTSVAVTVTNADGDTLTAPAVTDPAPAAGIVEITLTADDHLDQLSTLTVVATGIVDDLTQRASAVVDVVGASYVTIAELRGEPDMGDAVRIPKQLLAAIRDELEARIEEYLGYAMVPRYWAGQATVRPDGLLEVPWPRLRTIRSISIDGVAGDPADCSLPRPGGSVVLYGPGVPVGAVVTLGVEHGDDAPDGRLVRELKGAVRREVLARASRAPRDALSQTADGTTTRFSFAGARRPTGIPSLDTLLNDLQGPCVA
jgi:hypothetical protein